MAQRFLTRHSLMLTIITGLVAGTVGKAHADPGDWRLCVDPASRLERQYGMDSGLLHAVGMTESARRVADANDWQPWPWTINAEGTPYVFGTRAEAIAKVQELMGQGITSIDIGCMQISLHWHHTQFLTLEDVFEPRNNLAYAAEFLADLRERHGSWPSAIGHYHSSDPQRREGYLRKVLTHWRGGGPTETAVADTSKISPTWRASRAIEDGEYDTALALYEEQLAENPDDRLARLGRARVLDRMGREPDALQAWEELLVLANTDRQALARLISHARDLPASVAMDRARELRRLAPASPEVGGLMAELLDAEGKTEEAISLAAAAATWRPADALPWLNAAILLDRSGRNRAAANHYRTFLEKYRAAPVPLSISLDQVEARMRHLLRISGS